VRLVLVFDVTRDAGANFSAEVVAEKLAEEVGAMDKLFMEDKADTRYSINSVAPLRGEHPSDRMVT
jgi:hypothetical protein